MKYYQVKFTISCPEEMRQDAQDITAALAGDAGFETFEENEEGELTGYIQQQLYDQQALDASLAEIPFEEVSIDYCVSEAEDRDWNEQWEQQGFEPIVIGNGQMVIHDGRHLPELSGRQPLTVEIDAKLAFGTGSHETTRMICSVLLDLDLKGKRVLDAGCGTGILGITALKSGAQRVMAYDIDEWSVDNTRHNAILNQVERLEVMHGDATLLDNVDTIFDLVMANINRNILIQDMRRFRQVLQPKGLLVLSGFYEEDIPLLQGAAQGMQTVSIKVDGQWACLVLQEKD